MIAERGQSSGGNRARSRLSGNLVVDVGCLRRAERLFCATFGLPSVCLTARVGWVG